MTLLERTIAAESCTFQACKRERVRDSALCKEHLNDLLANRLDRLPSGEYVRRRTFVPRELSRVA